MIGPFYVNTEKRRIAAWGQPCKIPFSSITFFGKKYNVHRDTAITWPVFESICAKHRYAPEGTDTGFYNCRHMRHDPKLPWSAHSWATALDLDWLQNPAGNKLITNMPKPLIQELQTVKTTSGAYVWMWGGDWDRNPGTGHSYYDAMHWETVAHPLDLATGIAGYTTPTTPPEEDDVVLKQGDRSNAVRALQRHLNDWKTEFNLLEDGIFGASTASAVRAYQDAAGLPVTGACDSFTFGLLATNALRNTQTLKNILDR